MLQRSFLACLVYGLLPLLLLPYQPSMPRPVDARQSQTLVSVVGSVVKSSRATSRTVRMNATQAAVATIMV
jgi:hypothetical protein